MGQVLCPEKRQEKHRGTGAHRSTHPQGQGEQGQDAPTHHSHSTTQTHHRQGRQGTGHTTGQGHSTTQKHSTQKKAQESTQEYIEVCYSSSVEHKGTDHTVTPNHSTPLAPLREDMAQGIRACAVSSFACRRGTASP